MPTDGLSSGWRATARGGMNRMVDKVVIVSGAGDPVSVGCALRVAAEGGMVAIADRVLNDELLKVGAAAGDSVIHVPVEVTDATSWENLSATVIERFGRIDGLINAVALVNETSPDNVLDLTEDAWDSVLSTNLKGPWLGMRAVIPTMIQAGGGSIVNVASVAGLKALNNVASFTAAMGGLIAVGQQVALEYGPVNIRVNTLCPGTVGTGPFVHDETVQQTAQESPLLNEPATAAEIAAVATHFIADEASFCTGLTLPVDGGWTVNPRNF